MKKFLLLTLILGAPLYAAPAITLFAPANGTSLQGDRFATISWSADHAIDAEEWEAFLSVDGGHYYSVRITPHLDLDLHTFEFLVPNVASDDVRILMRVGDERIEQILEFPQRFSIKASAATMIGPAASAVAGPESARPGEAPVVQWASGGRNGANLEIARASASGASMRSQMRSRPESAQIVLTRISVRILSPEPDSSTDSAAFADAALRCDVCAPRNVLRLITRLNV